MTSTTNQFPSGRTDGTDAPARSDGRGVGTHQDGEGINDWHPIATAPRDGTRVRVGHQLDPSSVWDSKYFNTTGVFVNGEWVCTAGFVCTDGMFRFDPTHWKPA